MRQSNKKQLPWSQFINGLLEAKDGAAAALPHSPSISTPHCGCKGPTAAPPGKADVAEMATGEKWQRYPPIALLESCPPHSHRRVGPFQLASILCWPWVGVLCPGAEGPVPMEVPFSKGCLGGGCAALALVPARALWGRWDPARAGRAHCAEHQARTVPSRLKIH